MSRAKAARCVLLIAVKIFFQFNGYAPHIRQDIGRAPHDLRDHVGVMKWGIRPRQRGGAAIGYAE